MIDHAAFPASRFKVKSDSRILGMNLNRNHDEIACSEAAPFMHPMARSSRLLCGFSRSSCSRLASGARLGRAFLLSLLTCSLLPSFAHQASATSFFVYITIKSTPWQPALDNKFLFLSPRPHLTLPSLTINFAISRQESKPEPLSFQHQPSPITRQVPSQQLL